MELTVSILDEASEDFQTIAYIGIFDDSFYSKAACGLGRYQTGRGSNRGGQLVLQVSNLSDLDINGLQKMRITHRDRLFFCLEAFGSFRPCRTLDPDTPQYATPLESTIPIFGYNDLVTLTYKSRFVSFLDFQQPEFLN